MQLKRSNIGHSLYVLFETLPESDKKAFLHELMEQQQETVENEALYLACQQAKEENDFLTEQEAQDFVDHLPQ